MERARATFGAELRLVRRAIHEEVVLDIVDRLHTTVHFFSDGIGSPMKE